jgi:hypothetical protein
MRAIRVKTGEIGKIETPLRTSPRFLGGHIHGLCIEPEMHHVAIGDDMAMPSHTVMARVCGPSSWRAAKSKRLKH